MTPKYFKLLLFFLICQLSVYSQFDVTINGKFPGAEGKTVRLFEYSDMLTYRQNKIASYTVDDDARFKFNIQIYEPQYVFFRIDHARNGLFIEPGKTYNIEFDFVDFDLIDNRRNPYLDPLYFPFTITNEKPDGINVLIDSLDKLTDDFLYENFSIANRGRMAGLLADFKNSTNALFENVDNEFFTQYYKYKFGKLNNIIAPKSNNEVVAKYFFDGKIQYNNIEYMEFFNSFFENFVIRGSRNIRIQDVEFTVNELASYTALMDSLGKDTLLRNEVLREMVLLKTLDEIYHERDFSKRNIDSILNQVVLQSKFPRHKQIAENILWSKNYLSIGSPAPDLVLENEKGEKYSLSDFSGKFVYISFFTTWCIPCLAELPVKQDLYEQYGDFIEFISISVDRHTYPYYNFLRQNDYSWRFFHFNDDFNLLDDYQVRSYPVFILICPQGNILNYPRLYPSNAIAGYFERLKRIYFQSDRKNRQRLYYNLNR